MSVNIGHGDDVIDAIKEQAETLCYANPFMATEPRARLGAKLAEILPATSTLSSSPTAALTTENAIKLARFFTGRHKILARYRSYAAQPAAALRSPEIRAATGPPARHSRRRPRPRPYHGIERGWDSAETSSP